MAKLVACCLFVLICFPVITRAASGGYYVGGQLGGNLLDSVEAVGTNGPFNLSLAGGGLGSLLIGYDFADSTPRFAQGRVELELSARQNALDTVGFADGDFSAGGDLLAQSVMFNFFYETRALSPLLAYYGIGVGAARLVLDNATVSGYPLADGSDDILAYQAGLGLGYQINKNLTIDFGYRFFATDDAEFEDVRSRKFSVEYQSHTLLFGVRYLF